MKQNNLQDTGSPIYSYRLKRWAVILSMLLIYHVSDAQNAREINVTTLGVRPNDAQQDSKVIQRAIDNTQPGTTLFFPAGVYKIDEPINIGIHDITMRGEDSNTVFKFDNKQDYYAKYGQKTGMINIMANNVTIEHLSVDQNFRSSGRHPGDNALIGGIFLGGSYTGKPVKTSGITISNCRIYDYYGDGISVFHTSTDNFKVVNNTLISAFIAGNWDQCPKRGEQGISVAGGNNMYFANNVIRGAIDDAIASHVNCSNIKIIGNDITTIRGRILIEGMANGEVRDNKIEYIRNGWAAILISTAPELGPGTNNNHVVVENNRIFIDKGVKILAGIMLYGPGNDITITNNTIEAVDKQPAGIHLADRYAQKLKAYSFGDDIKIENNTIINFNTGIKFNITSNVKQPNVTLNNNQVVKVDKDVLRETNPFVFAPTIEENKKK